MSFLKNGRIPISVSYDGFKVLLKKVEKFNQDMLADAFHLSAIDEFYSQVVKTCNGYYLSVIRKEELKTIFDFFESLKIEMISFTLGPFSFNKIIPFVEDVGEEVMFDRYQITINNGEIDHIEIIAESHSTMISVGEERIDGFEVLSYCNALNYFINKGNVFLIETERGNGLIDYCYKEFYKQFIKIGLSVIFIVLVCNSLILFQESSKHNDLLQQYSFHQQKLARLSKLEEDFLIKKM